jgi:DNA-binding transcriptional ArsR family regulator
MKEVLAIGSFSNPEDEFIIHDLETLQLAADPLHLQLLTTIRDQSKSIKQVAAELQLDQVKLYYHFNLLESHGLVKVVMERKVRHLVERFYRIRAYRLRVEEQLLSIGSRPEENANEQMLVYVFDKAKTKLRKGLEGGWIEGENSQQPQRRFIAQRNSLRLPPEEARLFFEKMTALSRQFQEQLDSPGSYGDWYDFVLAMYPLKDSTPQIS